MTQQMTEHRLTWRGYFPIYIRATDRANAIAEAIAHQPACIPAGTELHYGLVGASAGAVYRAA